MSLERPGIEIAFEIVDISEQLVRVRKALPFIPEPFIKLLETQNDEYLYGMMGALLGLRDLSGQQTLSEAEMVIEHHEGIRPAVNMATTAAGMVSVLEAICYIVCKELTLRHNRRALREDEDEDDE